MRGAAVTSRVAVVALLVKPSGIFGRSEVRRI